MINARLLEAHAMLWVDLAMKRGYGRNIAFGLLRAV
jgi:8-hydroxy-5-deazaflavin:NADPH oxidoreductase